MVLLRLIALTLLVLVALALQMVTSRKPHTPMECKPGEDGVQCWLKHPPLCRQETPKTKLRSGMPTRGDTLGSLISNQVLWYPPGLDHMAHRQILK